MEQIPTAAQFLAMKELRPVVLMADKRLDIPAPSAVNTMIEFAKLHVEAALKAAAEKVQISGDWGDEPWNGTEISVRDIDGNHMALSIDEKSILNAYPLSNIK